VVGSPRAKTGLLGTNAADLTFMSLYSSAFCPHFIFDMSRLTSRRAAHWFNVDGSGSRVAPSWTSPFEHEAISLRSRRSLMPVSVWTSTRRKWWTSFANPSTKRLLSPRRDPHASGPAGVRAVLPPAIG
jgi:hypothetical protein